MIQFSSQGQLIQGSRIRQATRVTRVETSGVRGVEQLTPCGEVFLARRAKLFCKLQNIGLIIGLILAVAIFRIRRPSKPPQPIVAVDPLGCETREPFRLVGGQVLDRRSNLGLQG